MSRRVSIALASLAVTLCVRELHADDTPAPEPPEWTLAAQLLDEGRALMAKRGSLDQACETLRRSYILRKRGDTLLNLAECHRRQGKTATAWREFDEAIRYAKEADYTEAVRAAERYRDQLATTLSELVVEVPAQAERPPGLSLTLDGEPLPEQQWGQVLYVDPGTHKVEATAPDHEPFSASTEVAPKGRRSVLAVKLVPVPPPPPKEPDRPKPSPTKPEAAPEAPVWAIVVGSVGIAMMGVSVGLLVDSNAAGDELDDSCGGELRNACRPGSPYAETYAREVRSFGLFVGFGAGGLIAAGVGAAGLAIGLAVHPAPVAVLPWADMHGAGAVVGGRF